MTAHRAGSLEHATTGGQLNRMETDLSRCLSWFKPPPGTCSGLSLKDRGRLSSFIVYSGGGVMVPIESAQFQGLLKVF